MTRGHRGYPSRTVVLRQILHFSADLAGAQPIGRFGPGLACASHHDRGDRRTEARDGRTDRRLSGVAGPLSSLRLGTVLPTGGPVMNGGAEP
jgi:hypothetical protein